MLKPLCFPGQILFGLCQTTSPTPPYFKMDSSEIRQHWRKLWAAPFLKRGLLQSFADKTKKMSRNSMKTCIEDTLKSVVFHCQWYWWKMLSFSQFFVLIGHETALSQICLFIHSLEKKAFYMSCTDSWHFLLVMRSWLSHSELSSVPRFENSFMLTKSICAVFVFFWKYHSYAAWLTF